MATGKQCHFNPTSLGIDTTLGAALGWLVGPEISGVSAGRGSRAPISGWTKAQTRLLHDAIQANTGAIPIRWTPHAIRRAVATMVAQILGMSGDKIVKRVLGHADQEVTSLYNQYQYIKEVRRVLSLLTADLMSTGQCRMTYCLENSRFALPTKGNEMAHAA
jgi:hypothetical protein